MPPVSPMAVVLAAGASTRMRRPKALLDLDGRPLLRAHVDGLAAAGLAVRVVLGAQADVVASALRGSAATRVDNPTWTRGGPAASLLRAVADLDPARRVVVTPVDVPPAPADVLAALLAAPAPAVVTVHGAPGHPVLATAEALHATLPHGTLRDVVASATGVPVDWADAVRNLNTPGDWAAWRAAQRT